MRSVCSTVDFGSIFIPQARTISAHKEWSSARCSRWSKDVNIEFHDGVPSVFFACSVLHIIPPFWMNLPSGIDVIDKRLILGVFGCSMNRNRLVCDRRRRFDGVVGAPLDWCRWHKGHAFSTSLERLSLLVDSFIRQNPLINRDASKPSVAFAQPSSIRENLKIKSYGETLMDAVRFLSGDHDMPNKDAIDIIIQALDTSATEMCFEPLLGGVRAVLEGEGISFQRLQVPMTKPLGFRHPTFWGVLLTWSARTDQTEKTIITHEAAYAAGLPCSGADDPTDLTEAVAKSPYGYVFGRNDWFFTCDLSAPPKDFEVFQHMRSDGLSSYTCIRLPTPAAAIPAVLSIASEEPFPKDLRAKLESVRGLVGLACYAACRTSQANEIAHCYIGKETGPKVLEGNMMRGGSETIRAGIMFCDVRGFTALSETLGEAIVPVVNELFEVVGSEAQQRGGEILKFIGDAMLIVFRTSEDQHHAAARLMVETVTAAQARVADVSQRSGYDVSVGFGCHIGDVVYGNIGTSNRLDFTVMGSAVNLASRLESLCKPLEATAVFSESVQAHYPHLVFAGSQQLKGVRAPTSVWVLSQID